VSRIREAEMQAVFGKIRSLFDRKQQPARVEPRLDSPSASPSGEGIRPMAMVALSTPGAVAYDALAADLRTRFESLGLAIGPNVAPGEAGGPLMFTLNDLALVLMFIDRPIPSPELEEPISGSRITWKGVREEIAGHRGHVIVSTLHSGREHQGIRDGMVAISLATASIAALTSSIGVYWTHARLLTPSAEFIRSCEQQLPAGQAPIDVWMRIDFMRGRTLPEGQTTIGGFTVGLTPFIGRELEFVPSPLEAYVVAQRLLGMGQYLAINGPIVKDGDTFGIDQAERIRARLLPRAEHAHLPGPVIQLKVEHIRT
jgi:hypothetical protein